MTSSRTGRFTYLLAKGPARTLVVHYMGAAKIRSATQVVRVRVAASSTIHRSRRSVVNGEAVGFRGRCGGIGLAYGANLLDHVSAASAEPCGHQLR